MFGVIIAGRAPQTNLEQIDSTKYVFNLPDAGSINHLVVFMTSPFPNGYAATIHFGWPDKPFILLGMVSNDKPSAVFKLSNYKKLDMDSMMDDTNLIAKLGISIDSKDNVSAAVSQLGTMTSQPSDQSMMMIAKPEQPLSIASKILESFYNYCTSFSTNLPVGGQVLLGRESNTFIPIKAIQDWYTSTQRKLAANPNVFDEK